MNLKVRNELVKAAIGLMNLCLVRNNITKEFLIEQLRMIVIDLENLLRSLGEEKYTMEYGICSSCGKMLSLGEYREAKRYNGECAHCRSKRSS